MTRTDGPHKILPQTSYQTSFAVSTLQSRKTSKTKKVTDSQASPTPDTDDDGHSSACDYNGLNEYQIALKKQEQQKERKARNQRRYYQRHKAEQQAKARERAARKRVLERAVWDPNEDEDGHNFSPVPGRELPTGNINGGLPSTPQFRQSPSLYPVDHNADGYNMYTHHPLIPHEDEDHEFLKHDIRGRLAFIRRMLLSLDPDWGAVCRWPVTFARDWACVKGGGREVVYEWFDKVRGLLKNGWRAIGYVNRVMEGTGPSNMDECRDLFLEAQHLSADLYTGVVGLEYKLDSAVEQYQSIAFS